MKNLPLHKKGIIVIHCQFSKIEIKNLIAFVISFRKIPNEIAKLCRMIFEKSADYCTEKLIIDDCRSAKL